MSLSKSRAQLRLASDAANSQVLLSGSQARLPKRQKQVVDESGDEPVFASTLAKDDLIAWKVDARVADSLVEVLGIERFFTLQRHALECLMLNEPLRDACISARTGPISGFY